MAATPARQYSGHLLPEAVMALIARIKSLLSKKGPKPTPRPQPPSGPYRPEV